MALSQPQRMPQVSRPPPQYVAPQVRQVLPQQQYVLQHSSQVPLQQSQAWSHIQPIEVPHPPWQTIP